MRQDFWFRADGHTNFVCSTQRRSCRNVVVAWWPPKTCKVADNYLKSCVGHHTNIPTPIRTAHTFEGGRTFGGAEMCSARQSLTHAPTHHPSTHQQSTHTHSVKRKAARRLPVWTGAPSGVHTPGRLAYASAAAFLCPTRPPTLDAHPAGMMHTITRTRTAAGPSGVSALHKPYNQLFMSNYIQRLL